MQGTRTSRKRRDDDREDLGALVVARSLSPAPKTLFGLDFSVRRDLTADEYVAYWESVNAGESVASLGMLLTQPSLAATLNAKLNLMPREHMNKVLARIMRTAGVLDRTPEDDRADDDREHADEDGGAGEHSASS
jgi:hypothetical protein